MMWNPESKTAWFSLHEAKIGLINEQIITIRGYLEVIASIDLSNRWLSEKVCFVSQVMSHVPYQQKSLKKERKEKKKRKTRGKRETFAGLFLFFLSFFLITVTAHFKKREKRHTR